MGCCSPGAFDDVFDERQARRDLRRYRRRGLRRDARSALAFLRSRDLEGASVLEAGGGIGAFQLELLRAGAASAVDVELSPGYEPAAAELLAGSGLEDRVERRLGDLAAEPDGEPADVVALIRVACCYPDPDRLVGAAARRTRRLLVLTYPADNLVARLAAAAGNLVLRLTGSEFRAFAHPHARIHAAAERQGLRLVHRGGGPVWRVAGFERFRPPPAGNPTGMDDKRKRHEHDEAERAAQATEASRRERGNRRIQDQKGLGAGRDGDGKPRPF